ncbi:MAG TPA: hypothetical protein VK463_19145 [Desulfomonilaceae bacterium]|nr:hypothetical protein [Desulfomonilaceae bacterium]
MNLQQHIERYVELVCRADRLFESVRDRHGDLLSCKPGCDDCCSVYFQLSLIEAFFLSGMVRQHLRPTALERTLARADRIEPLFRQATTSLAHMHGAGRQELSDAAARLRVPCPLKEDRGCVLYEHRPITCRLYGVPQRIRGRVLSCPHNGFREGASYIAVDVDGIQETLHKYSREFLEDLIGSVPSARPRPLYSVSQALRTDFNRNFFEKLREALS